jgi:hypothetical protein
MKRYFLYPLLSTLILFLFLAACTDESPSTPPSLYERTHAMEGIEGKEAYLNSPFVTAGQRLYMVGYQNGQFPDLGWHVEGEMGGIWDHPVKLMDGFGTSVGSGAGEAAVCLSDAVSFVNYPMANQHRFQVEELGLEAYRTQFVPDSIEGLIVEYYFKNLDDRDKDLRLSFTGMVDLRPVWLGERTGMVDHRDLASYDQQAEAFIGWDSANSWFVAFGAGRPPVGYEQGPAPCSHGRRGQGVDATLYYDIAVPAGGAAMLTFSIAGSYRSREEAVRTLQQLRADPYELFRRKKARYEEIEAAAQLDLPDERLEQLYTWTKYCNDWLVIEVPEFGRGIAAGIPDYPWWFGVDQSYTVRGLLPTGRHDLARDALDLLLRFSEETNGNGRIVHEVSSNGAVFNPGNVNETPFFIGTAWEYFTWTGDRDFLARAYRQARQGLEWIERQDRDGNGYPDGYGIMEIHGLDPEMIDVVVYTQEAYAAAAKMAAVMEDEAHRRIYETRAARLREQINADWWVEGAASFADFRSGKEKAAGLLRDAQVRADTLGKTWAIKALKAEQQRLNLLPDEGSAGHAFYHNWVVNTPMETGAADTAKAIAALDKAHTFTNRFGVYVTGIDREEETAEDSFASSREEEEFSYVGAVMTLPTSVQAVAECQYGRSGRALEYLNMLANSFSYAAPGSMYEVSPDYGMLVQAWNIYGKSLLFNGLNPFSVYPFQPKGTKCPDCKLQTANCQLNTADCANALPRRSSFYRNRPGSLAIGGWRYSCAHWSGQSRTIPGPRRSCCRRYPPPLSGPG